MKLVTFETGTGPRAGVLDGEGCPGRNRTPGCVADAWMEGNAWNMHHTSGAMIERASQDSRVVPGDVIASGTIGGGSISESVRKGYPVRWLQA